MLVGRLAAAKLGVPEDALATGRKLRFEEVHIRYLERIGDVKLRKWRDGWENLIFLLRKRLGRAA